MAELLELGYDKMTITTDTKANILLNKDKLNDYELVISTDTKELLYKDSAGTILDLVASGTDAKLLLKLDKGNYTGTAGNLKSDIDKRIKAVGDVIPSASDMNTYKTAGHYAVISDAVAPTLINSPYTKSFNLYVETLDTGTRYVKQIASAYDSHEIKTRFTTGSDIWSTWATIFNSSNSPKSNAVDSVSEINLATSKAVKTSYDKGVEALNKANKMLPLTGGDIDTLTVGNRNIMLMPNKVVLHSGKTTTGIVLSESYTNFDKIICTVLDSGENIYGTTTVEIDTIEEAKRLNKWFILGEYANALTTCKMSTDNRTLDTSAGYRDVWITKIVGIKY